MVDGATLFTGSELSIRSKALNDGLQLGSEVHTVERVLVDNLATLGVLAVPAERVYPKKTVRDHLSSSKRL